MPALLVGKVQWLLGCAIPMPKNARDNKIRKDFFINGVFDTKKEETKNKFYCKEKQDEPKKKKWKNQITEAKAF